MLTRTDLPSRLSVKRGGKLISKTFGKATLPTSISAPPKAAVGASKVKKDEVQRRKNSHCDVSSASSKEKLVASLEAKDRVDGKSSHVDKSSEPPGIPDTATGSYSSAFANMPQLTPQVDQKIKQLESALEAARAEAAVLRQNLEGLREDARASIEIFQYHATGTSQHTAIEELKIQVDAEDESYEHSHVLQHQGQEREKDLVTQNHDFRYCIAELQDQLTTRPSAADWDALTLRLHKTEKESHSRLQQLLSLKFSISSLTRTNLQVSDSELAESFSQLANRTREWVISNFRRTKMNLHALPPATAEILKSIKADYEDIKGTEKLALYQAIVSRLLMCIFNEILVVGVPDQGPYAGLRKFSVDTQDAGVEFREWRRATLQVIEKSRHCRVFQEWKEQELQRLATETENVLSSISYTRLVPGAQIALISILNTAAALQRTLCLQKAGYRLLFFGTGNGRDHRFDFRTMESVNDPEYAVGEGDDSGSERRLSFCVFPCLEKYNSDVGDSTEISSIVLRARVHCGVG